MDLLEPCALVWVRNFYSTEEMDQKVAAALKALPSSTLFAACSCALVQLPP